MMSSKSKKEARFSLDSPIITVSKETTTFSSRGGTKNEKPILTVRKPPAVSPTLLPYTPPDALMFALFGAIQRRAWVRARKLCYELILCDPWRQTYRDLHSRIDQIIRVIDQRIRPPRAPTKLTIASSTRTDGDRSM